MSRNSFRNSGSIVKNPEISSKNPYFYYFKYSFFRKWKEIIHQFLNICKDTVLKITFMRQKKHYQKLSTATICQPVIFLHHFTVFRFNRVCSRHLNKGFQMVERIQSQYLKQLKCELPRRESARRNHPYARHCDILTGIDTRLNLLSMTFGKYIDADLCCFIPGKIIDEIYSVMRMLKNSFEAPKTLEVLQVL